MSRLTTMSPEAIKAVFSPDSDKELFILLTIYDPEDETTPILWLTDSFNQRISENSEEVTYGVVSRGQSFTFLPVEISLPSEEEAQAPRCSISITDVTRYVVPLLRETVGQPKVLMELVLSSSPNTVEVSFDGFYIVGATYSMNTVSLELSMVDYEREPFPAHSFSPLYFPGLF